MRIVVLSKKKQKNMWYSLFLRNLWVQKEEGKVYKKLGRYNHQKIVNKTKMADMKEWLLLLDEKRKRAEFSEVRASMILRQKAKQAPKRIARDEFGDGCITIQQRFRSEHDR